MPTAPPMPTSSPRSSRPAARRRRRRRPRRAPPRRSRKRTGTPPPRRSRRASGRASRRRAVARTRPRRAAPHAARPAACAGGGLAGLSGGGCRRGADPGAAGHRRRAAGAEPAGAAVAGAAGGGRRAPDDAELQADARRCRRRRGCWSRAVRTEVEADPPRACLAFTIPPARRPDFHPQDWVKLDPPAPDAAVTREGDQICISGLPLGATTRVMLTAGMPGEGGVDLLHGDATRGGDGQSRAAPRLRQPAVPAAARPGAAITLTSVNLSAVKLRLVRASERAMLPWTRENRLGDSLEIRRRPARGIRARRCGRAAPTSRASR